MAKANQSGRLKTGRRELMLRFVLVSLLAWSAFAFLQRLAACAMSALISVESQTLSEFQPQGPASQYWDYNDPADYLGFVMANSNRSANNDGYGIAIYQDREPQLQPKNSWYKRVAAEADFGQVYYTGHHLDPDLVDTTWETDILDQALQSLQDGSNRAAIVLAHARNASGRTFGNHPFWFEHKGTTYTFMHNGYSGNARAFMIGRISQLRPEEDWFAAHPSNHLQDADPFAWVDTELLFRYIMYHVMDRGDQLLSGLHAALASLTPYLTASTGGVYNFILSDGDRLYAFRSTPQSGPGSSYDLSYKAFPNQYYAVRTQTPQFGDVELRQGELVVFSRDRKPLHYPEFVWNNLTEYGLPEPAIASRANPQEQIPGLIISPNPFRGSARLRFSVASPATLRLEIYNFRGERVWLEKREVLQPGIIDVAWNSQDQRGKRLPAGIYFVRASAGPQAWHGRMVLLE